MKRAFRYIYIAALACGAGLMATSCNDEFAQAPVQQPYPEIGTGTWDKPLQAWQAHLGTTLDDRTSNWVTGYVVGWIDTGISNTFSAESAVLGKRAAVQSNILLAQYPYDEEEWKRLGYTIEECVPVQLPSGPSRSYLNLEQNFEKVYNKQVTLKGTTGSKYCGAYGIRQCYDFNLGPKGKYEQAYDEAPGTEYYCDFQASYDINYYYDRGWKHYAVRGGLNGWSIYEVGSNSYVQISAYYGSLSAGPYEYWLVTPAFNIKEAEQKTLSFSTQAQNYVDGVSLRAYVLNTPNPKYGDPQEIHCPISESNDWTKSGVIDLSDLAGDNDIIYIGFQFVAEHGGSTYNTNYGIDDVNLGGADPKDWEYVDPATIGTFRETDTLSDGEYLMVFNGNELAVPLPTGSNYGYLSVKEVAPVEGVLTNSKTQAFTLTQDEGGTWTIQGQDGRYYYMQGTYTSFQVGDNPQSQYKWRISGDGDGGFEIYNVERKLYMDYSEQFDNITLLDASKYSGKGVKLYRLEE